jgi:hypothetical protein
MQYIVYHITSTQTISRHSVASAAKRSTTCRNRNAGREAYAWASEEDYNNRVVTMKRVRDLLTGEEVEIASNTPRCLDPSSELYHSM